MSRIMKSMKLLVVLLTIAIFLVLLDRLLLYCERRGWIFYRKKKPSPGTAASAFLEVHSLIEQGKKHVVEIQKEQVHEEDDKSGE